MKEPYTSPDTIIQCSQKCGAMCFYPEHAGWVKFTNEAGDKAWLCNDCTIKLFEKYHIPKEGSTMEDTSKYKMSADYKCIECQCTTNEPTIAGWYMPDSHTPDVWLCGSCYKKRFAPLKHDPVNHPKHYTSHPSGVECIDITAHMNFCRGNAIKYIWRAGDKGNEIEDLKKAAWYVNREIQRLEKGK